MAYPPAASGTETASTPRAFTVSPANGASPFTNDFPIQVTASTAIAPPTIAPIRIGETLVSSRAMGLVLGRPLLSLPPDSNSSGAWTLTSSTTGMTTIVLHLGQGPLFPANFSLTRKFALQPGQMTAIGMQKAQM
jgi:hypothetical protein